MPQEKSGTAKASHQSHEQVRLIQE